MTQLTPAQLGTKTAPSDGDLFVGYPAGGPMYSITALNFRTYALMGALLLDGSTTMTGAFKASNGTQSNPSLTFGSDTGTGLYRVSASKLGITVGGANILTLDASGGIAAQGAAPFVGNLTGNVTGNVTGNLTGNVTGSVVGTAAAWTTARTLSFTGGATGSGSIDGSANVAITLTVPTPAPTLTAKSGGTYTAIAGDANSSIRFTGVGLGAAGTIPANASVAYAIGTFLEWVNGLSGSSSITVAITSDTLNWGSSTGTRTVAQGGVLCARKMAATVWNVIYGVGIS